jgi:hypothetical protein
MLRVSVAILSLCAVAQARTRARAVDVPATSISAQDSSLYYSPYAWAPVGAGGMGTINSGAYMRVLFSGNTVELSFDVSQMVAPVSQVYTRIDNGPLLSTPVGATISLAVPPNLTHGDVP